jgi:hypothetical protein
MAYIPSQHSLTAKPMGMSQATPTDGRSYFYDTVNFVYRPYQSVAEVLAYLNLPKYRFGSFPIYINATGTLNGDGTFTGGSVEAYIFKDGTTDPDLVTLGSGAVSSVNGQSGIVNLVKADIGLSNVDNTSDVNKPVSTATAAALANKANLASPTFTGVPVAPTASAGTNTTQLATTAFVTAAVAGGGLDAESVRDTIGTALQGTGLIAVTPNDGSDTITISTTATANSSDATLLSRANHTGTQAQSTVTNLVSDLAGKQATLVSATNIKTINGSSVLGSGDLSITAGDEAFANLSGTTWDGSRAYKVLTSNTSLTLDTVLNFGTIYVQQGAGPYTLSINGTAITIATTDDEWTKIDFAFIGSEYIVTVDNAPGDSYIIQADFTAPTITTKEALTTTTIEVTFDESTSGTHAGWSAEVNGGSAINATSITGAGTVRTLTFPASSFANGDTITISYNPGTGDTVDGASNELATVTDSAVTNSIADTTAPTLVSATVENATPTQVDLVFNEAMNSTWSAAAAFGVTGSHSVTTVTRLTGTTGYLTISPGLSLGETVTLSYTQPGSNKMQDLAGNLLANISSASITNNVGNAFVDLVPTSVSGTDYFLNTGPKEWTVQGSAGFATATSGYKVPSGQTGAAIFKYRNSSGTRTANCFIGFTSANTEVNHPGMSTAILFDAVTDEVRTWINGALNSTPYAVNDGDYVWMIRDTTASTITVESSTTLGGSRTLLYTFSGGTYSYTAADLWIVFKGDSGGNVILEPVGWNVTP